jgi:transcriptional regulator with XRE-family HTH domain
MLGLLMPMKDRLKSLRKAKGMTQLDVAKASGLSLSIITQIEQGLTSDPKLSTLNALARALGVSLDELAKDEGQESQQRPAPATGPKRRPRGRPRREG